MLFTSDNIKIGLALSCANHADRNTNADKDIRIPRDVAFYAQKYFHATGQGKLVVEFQPERIFVELKGDNSFIPKYDNGWLRLIHPHGYPQDENSWRYLKGKEILNQSGHIKFMHHPCIKINTFDTNPFKKRQSIETIKAVMWLAHECQSDAFVFHVIQKDDWITDRNILKKQAFNIFSELMNYYNQCHFTFIPCIENVEFPKFPSTLMELNEIYQWFSSVAPRLKIVLDIPHLWRSQTLILLNENWRYYFKEISKNDLEILMCHFNDYLRYTLENIPCELINYFHMAGCCESSTHGIPGLHDDKNPLTDWIELDGSYDYYEGNNEIHMNVVIDLLLEYLNKSWQQQNRQDLKIILEIFDRPIEQVIKGLQVFRQRIIDKVNNKPLTEYKGGMK